MPLETTYDTQVAIIGAGPTGLSLACQLDRYGIDFILLDKSDGVTPYSKAIGVQARTLEIYDQMELAQRAIDEGTKADRAQLVVGGEVRGKLDFSAIGQGLSVFPFMLLLEQSKNERMLHDYLQSHNREVFWGTTFQGLTHDESSATVQASDKGGAVRTLKAQYLVGCDGAKSTVRDSLGLGFEGSTFERMFFVADVQLEWSFTHDSVYICLGRDNVLIFFPLKGEDRYRIVGSFPEDSHKDEREVSYDEIMAQIKTESHLDFQIHDVNWFSTYKVHTRHVERFSEGRCFVAGDAAHIHSPAGAQGMNTGIQDAYNLAWKLALVLKGNLPSVC